MNRIKQIRKENNWTQKEMAELFEIPIRTIQGWEQDERTPPQYVIKMIEAIIKLK